MFRNTSRLFALLLAVMLFVGIAHAESASANVMREPQNLGDVAPEDGDQQPFWGQLSIPRSWVRRIEFHNTTEGAPENILDFSAANDYSVIGWYTPGELHIAADGPVSLNPKSSWMFAYFTNLKEVHFNGAVDTSQVTKLDHLFFACPSLEYVDVDSFDTSSATDLSWMFAYCERLNALDVSGFRTDKVTDFSYMFFFCRNVPELDVTGFNTSNAHYMMSMFFRCEHVRDVDISGFDMSHIISATHMLDYCGIY